MPQSHYSALGEGLKLYTDAMRRFVKQRLVAAFPSTWWEDGVVKNLPDTRKRQVANDIAKAPRSDKAEFLDPGIFIHVITRNHARFQDAFPNYRQTASLLTQISESRNTWAHPPSADLPGDEVALALMAMEKLLSDADLPEAAGVETLRREVQGIPAAGPESPEVTQPAGQAAPTPQVRSGTGVPYWWEVCEPHDGFKNPAQVNESRFAASLGRVFAGAADAEYLDPVAFLSQTYFTENLTQMVREIASRLNGGDGASVTEVQTPFGGGKTHALLTFYHLMNSPALAMSVPAVQQALGDASIPADARVLVFDGQEHGTEPMLKENGISVSTMWGELTNQIDAGLYNRLIQECDGKGEAPGNAVFAQVLEAAAPCLILIDEVVSYLVKLNFSNSRRTQNLYRQTVQFLQETLQLAGSVPGVCVLISLPKSRTEFGGIDPRELQGELRIMDELQPRADRVVSKRTPVNDDEVYLLMSRRLFKRADANAAQAVAEAYRDVYEKTPGQYDATVRSTDYFNQQVAAYPFHPELIDVLYKKWSTASDFPRTRAVLQLLANIVADQWTNRRESYAIQSSHIDLGRERIRTRIVSAAGSGGGYEGVVASDIIGGDAHADHQDQRRGGEYARHRISRGVATTLLTHSFGGLMQPGAATQELRLGTVAPNVGLEYVSEVLGSLEQSLWYVHREGELLKFQTRPNIYRVIAQTAETRSPQQVGDRLRQELEKACGNEPGFRTVTWAGADGTIADSPDPTIALLDPARYLTAGDVNGVSDGSETIKKVWDRVGGGLRTYRNSLVLVAPDTELWKSAEEAVREVMAYEAVMDGSTAGQLSEADKRELSSRRDDKRNSLTTSIVTAYRWVFYPGDHTLETGSLPVPATSREKIAGRVIRRLSDQDYGTPKILRRMSAVYFNSRFSPRLWRDESNALDLSEAARRFPQWTFLPILPDREETLRNCIREGVGQNLWAVVVGDNATSTYQQLIDTPEALDQMVSLFDGSASLVKGDLLQLIQEELRPAAGPETPNVPHEHGVAPDNSIYEEQPTPPEPPPVIPPPTKRLTRVRLNVNNLDVSKTSNLQPYLFKLLQEQDAGARVNVTIEVSSTSGISPDILNQRIVEGFDQLGIEVEWEEG